MTTAAPPSVARPAPPAAFLIATTITLLIGLSHLYAEFAPTAPAQREYEQFLQKPVSVAEGAPTYMGLMESLRLTLSGLWGTIGMVNLLALKDAAPTLRQRASLVYCVAFALLGVLYRAHDLLIPGSVLGAAAICYLTDAVRGSQ